MNRLNVNFRTVVYGVRAKDHDVSDIQINDRMYVGRDCVLLANQILDLTLYNDGLPIVVDSRTHIISDRPIELVISK